MIVYSMNASYRERLIKYTTGYKLISKTIRHRTSYAKWILFFSTLKDKGLDMYEKELILELILQIIYLHIYNGTKYSNMESARLAYFNMTEKELID